jgi:hypothetical protein
MGEGCLCGESPTSAGDFTPSRGLPISASSAGLDDEPAEALVRAALCRTADAVTANYS